jgi:hypothetical protein
MNMDNLLKIFSLSLFISFSNVANSAELTTFQYKSHTDDIYELNDGTVFKKVGYGYVGYMGYNQEVVFLEGDIVCMNGGQYKYKLYEAGRQYHYTKTTYSGSEAYAKFEEICGE